MAALAFFLALVAYIWSFSKQDVPPVSTNEKPVIAASFYPLAFLAREIAGSDYEVVSVTPGGVEPHDFEPSPQDIVRLQSAKLLFANGFGIDAWVERLQPTLIEHGVKVVTLTDGIDSKGITVMDSNPHLWLDPQAMEVYAQTIAKTLSSQFPSQQMLFTANAKAMEAKLSALDRSYKTGLVNCRLHEVIVSHDAFAYLASRYEFSVIAIAGFSPQEQPSAKHIGELVTLAKEKGIKTIFFETLVSPKLSQTLAAEVGATTSVLDPIEGFSETDLAAGKSYFTAMESNLQALRVAMECQ